MPRSVLGFAIVGTGRIAGDLGALQGAGQCRSPLRLSALLALASLPETRHPSLPE